MLSKRSLSLLMVTPLLLAGCKDDLRCECVMRTKGSGLISTNFEVNRVVKEKLVDPMIDMRDKGAIDDSKYLGPYIFTIDGRCSFITLFERSNSDTTQYYSKMYDARMEQVDSDRARNCIKLARALNYINL